MAPTKKMRAARFSEYGGPEVLRIVEVDEPHAARGQVRITVRAAGVNPIDAKIRAGFLREVIPLVLPAGTGAEASGVVDEVGDGVQGIAVGDAVFGAGNATYAERAVLTSFIAKPDAMSFDEAAGYAAVVETALRILKQVGIRSGETLLVSGAAGGVGSAVLQIARRRGIAVIGTASAKNHAYVQSLGATPTTYGAGLVGRVRALSPKGIDAALDLAGSGIVPELIELTGDAKKVLSIADFSAPQHGAQVSAAVENMDAALAEAAKLFVEGTLRIPVARAFPLAEAAAAQAESAAGHTVGKLVIKVS